AWSTTWPSGRTSSAPVPGPTHEPITTPMCGRFTLHDAPEHIVRRFRLRVGSDFLPRYNVAPSQRVAAVREGEQGRELVMLRWGLIPHWSKDAKIAYSLINARAETVATKPAYRSAFRKRRCLIPASGFL